MKNGLVSVITPCYNVANTLVCYLQSLLNQTYENIEVIIGDDGTNQFNIEFYKNYINKRKFKNIKNNINNIFTIKSKKT